jgi:hypothetical protein
LTHSSKFRAVKAPRVTKTMHTGDLAKTLATLFSELVEGAPSSGADTMLLRL